MLQLEPTRLPVRTGAICAHAEDNKEDTPMSTISAPLRRWPNQQPLLFLLLAGAAWFGLYQTVMPASETLVAAGQA